MRWRRIAAAASGRVAGLVPGSREVPAAVREDLRLKVATGALLLVAAAVTATCGTSSDCRDGALRLSAGTTPTVSIGVGRGLDLFLATPVVRGAVVSPSPGNCPGSRFHL